MSKVGTIANYNYSVLLPVYAGDNVEWFKLACESVINQTIVSNDIIIIIDGPVGDKMREAIYNYEKTYKQVRCIWIKDNTGLWNALNVGLSKAKNELIMRMDADDIAILDRADLQIAEFRKDPGLSLLGGQISEFRENIGDIDSRRLVPLSRGGIVSYSKRRSPFNHPTVMFRKSAIESVGGYSRLFRTEDYDLWMRVLDKGFEARNLERDLLYYRVSSENLERKSSWRQQKETILLFKSFYERGFINLGEYFAASFTRTLFALLPRGIKLFAYSGMRSKNKGGSKNAK